MNDSSSDIIISLDAMGGDKAPECVVLGAALFAKKKKDVNFIFFGDESAIKQKINSHSILTNRFKIVHTSDKIQSDEKPSVAVRKGRNSSMWLAISSIKEKKSNAIVSAGNTGALMAMAKLILRTLPGIDRPAITSFFPTKKGKCVLLDLGANVDCNSDNLVQFAIMGNAFSKVLLGLNSPKIGLLNIGSEQSKGSEIIKAAAFELKENELSLNYCGFVEGDQIPSGNFDVIVTDGFTGNIALKTAEGTAKICSDYLKQAFKSSPLSMLGGLLSFRSIKNVFKKMDPRLHNGAMFVGLNGIAVKSHGGTDEIGFANAIDVAYSLVKNQINKKIKNEISSFDYNNDDIETTNDLIEN